MNKTTTYLVAAVFAVSTASAFAAQPATDKDAKKPTAAECKKDPKLPGCDEMKKKK